MNLLFGANGVVNALITGATGGSPVQFTSAAEYFRPMYIGSTGVAVHGFNAIVYIACRPGRHQPRLYEAAVVDGATKLQRIFYIDIPLIMPTVILMLILAIGQIMGLGYEKAYLMQTGTNTTVSEIITTYTYKVGLQGAQYSFATAGACSTRWSTSSSWFWPTSSLRRLPTSAFSDGIRRGNSNEQKEQRAPSASDNSSWRERICGRPHL